MRHPDTLLSLSVVCYHTPDRELESLLASLIRAIACVKQEDPGTHCALFLIDNSEAASLDAGLLAGYQSRLAQYDTTVELLQGHGNVGYGAGHNLAIGKSNAAFHLCLNPDVVLDERCLLEGLRYLQANPEVVMISPYASTADGGKQYLCKRYPSVGLFLLRGFFPDILQWPFRRALARFEMRELPEDNASSGIPIISGCFMFCRLDALRRAQAFDEGYFLYFEDFDLSLRMARQGQVAYLPAMKIQHQGGNSARKGLRHIRLFVRSARRFFSTHGWRVF